MLSVTEMTRILTLHYKIMYVFADIRAIVLSTLAWALHSSLITLSTFPYVLITVVTAIKLYQQKSRWRESIILHLLYLKSKLNRPFLFT